MHRLLLFGATSLVALCLSGPASAWSWPADGDVLRPFTLGGDAYAAGQHRGIDVAGADGSAVRAPASGTVSFAGSLPTYGRGVTILTSDGYAVTLVHLGSIGVAKGDSVAEGSSVGTMGSSGDAEHAVPTVHLGVRVATEAEGYVDPLGLLPPRSAAPVQPPGAFACSSSGSRRPPRPRRPSPPLRRRPLPRHRRLRRLHFPRRLPHPSTRRRSAPAPASAAGGHEGRRRPRRPRRIRRRPSRRRPAPTLGAPDAASASRPQRRAIPGLARVVDEHPCGGTRADHRGGTVGAVVASAGRCRRGPDRRYPLCPPGQRGKACRSGHVRLGGP